MISDTRQIEADMQLLWARLETVCATFDQLVTALVGSPRGFTLMVHPKEPGHATLSVTNMPENVEAVRDWLKHMDARNEPPEPLDWDRVNANLAAIERGAKAKADEPDAWGGSVLVKKKYRLSSQKDDASES